MEGLRIEGPLPRDDQVGLADPPRQVDRVHHDLDSGTQAGTTEGQQTEPQATRGTRAWLVPKGTPRSRSTTAAR